VQEVEGSNPFAPTEKRLFGEIQEVFSFVDLQILVLARPLPGTKRKDIRRPMKTGNSKSLLRGFWYLMI
jgi:hypothetical protein